jgi:uncharacterized Zn ribbon protein
MKDIVTLIKEQKPTWDDNLDYEDIIQYNEAVWQHNTQVEEYIQIGYFDRISNKVYESSEEFSHTKNSDGESSNNDDSVNVVGDLDVSGISSH